MKALAILLLCACSAPGHGYESPEPQLSAQHTRALRAMGIKNAKPAGYIPFFCSDSDSLFNSAGFEANGVNGMVCCGILNGCTVRFE